jgi:hypothetical protein
MKFVQHIKEIFFCRNRWSTFQEENEKKNKFSQKISFILDSRISVWTFSLNLWFRIYNMGFVQHIQVKIFPENLSQNKAEEEN